MAKYYPVEVITKTDECGQVMPDVIVWNGNRTFLIERIIHVCQPEDLIIRYTVKVVMVPAAVISYDCLRQVERRPAMADSILRVKSKEFCKDIILLCRKMREQHVEAALINQLLRCGTSVGANIAEAQYAQGTKDFISKLEIALKECNESAYWIELLYETDSISNRVNLVSDSGSTEDIVRKAVQSVIGKFTKNDIHELIPSVGEKTLERYIKILCDKGEIEKYGSGRATYYVRLK